MKNHNHFFFQAVTDYSLHALKTSKNKFYQLLIDTELNLIQIDFSFIVFCELLDNAYKYGLPNSLLNGIVWKYAIEDREVEISTLNAVKEHSHLDSINEIVQIIHTQSQPDPYISRLRQIFDHPEDPKTLLGLYRISSEAKFTINVKYANEILEVQTKRKF